MPSTSPLQIRTINSTKLNFPIETGSSLLEGIRGRHAVTAPWGIEFDEEW
jgi:hypothetical protein